MMWFLQGFLMSKQIIVMSEILQFKLIWSKNRKNWLAYKENSIPLLISLYNNHSFASKHTATTLLQKLGIVSDKVKNWTKKTPMFWSWCIFFHTSQSNTCKHIQFDMQSFLDFLVINQINSWITLKWNATEFLIKAHLFYLMSPLC